MAGCTVGMMMVGDWEGIGTYCTLTACNSKRKQSKLFNAHPPSLPLTGWVAEGRVAGGRVAGGGVVRWCTCSSLRGEVCVATTVE